MMTENQNIRFKMNKQLLKLKISVKKSEFFKFEVIFIHHSVRLSDKLTKYLLFTVTWFQPV